MTRSEIGAPRRSGARPAIRPVAAATLSPFSRPGRRPTASLRRGWRSLIALVAVVALGLLTGCEARTELNITVEGDGSGSVELAGAVDDEVLADRPDLLADLRIDHLVDAGWDVTGPVREADGLTWVRARHDFDDVDEIEGLVAAAVGENGPFRQVSVVRDDSFRAERFRFAGTVDFTDGLGTVGGDGADGSEPDGGPGDGGGPDLPDDVASAIGDLDAGLAAAIDDVFVVQVAVRLPGDVDSNAPTRAANGAVWQPSVLAEDPVELRATGEVSHASAVVLTIGGGVVAVVAVLGGAVALASRRRSRP